MTRPRVLMVTGAYHPELSGAGLQCRTLVRELGGRAACVVLTTTADPALPAAGTVDGVPVYRVQVDVTSRRSLGVAASRLVATFLRQAPRCDIVHLHGFSRKSVPLIALARVLRRKVAIKLTSVGRDDPISLRRHGRLAYACYAAADAFFGVSPRFAELYAQAGLPPERFHLIPNGVDLDRFRPAAPGERDALRDALGLPAGLPAVLFAGFFSREKQPDLLFRAWARLRAGGGPRSLLIFVGATRSRYHEVDHRLAETIRAEAVRLGLDKDVIFVERADDIERYYRAADVFALSSSREGLPNVLLEAMATGLACVATALPGVTDSLIADRTHGLLVPPGDEPALATALGTALDGGGASRSLGERARRRIEERYSIGATAEQYLAVYRALAGLNG